MSYYKVPLIFMPQPEGGYTVTCPVIPELVTEGDTLEEARANVADALAAVVEIYEETGRRLPDGVRTMAPNDPLWAETLIEVP